MGLTIADVRRGPRTASVDVGGMRVEIRGLCGAEERKLLEVFACPAAPYTTRRDAGLPGDPAEVFANERDAAWRRAQGQWNFKCQMLLAAASMGLNGYRADLESGALEAWAQGVVDEASGLCGQPDKGGAGWSVDEVRSIVKHVDKLGRPTIEGANEKKGDSSPDRSVTREEGAGS